MNRIYEYLSYDTSEFLLYDFSKNANDTIPNIGYGAVCIVDSVDSVFVGHYRKRMFVRYGPYYESMGFHDTWIDGIGALNRIFIEPEPIAIPLVYFGDTLVCFFENNQVLYHNSNYDTCVFNLYAGINESVFSDQFTLFPNPATTQLSIQTSGTAIEQVNIYNTTGSLVLSALGSTIVNSQLSIVHLPSGVYIADIKTKEGSARKRWVKM